MATMNFERTQTFLGYGTRQQWALVTAKAGEDRAVEIAGADSIVLGVLFNVNKEDGEPCGVITDVGVKVCGIASGAISNGDYLVPDADGKVKKGDASTGVFVAVTSAAADGEFVEMVRV